MLRRKTIIVLIITLMVTVMVSAFSYLYILQVLRLRIENAHETARQLAYQLAYAAEINVPDFSSTPVDTNNPVAVRNALVEYLQTDIDLNNMLESAQGSWAFLMDAAIVGPDGKALLDTDAAKVGKVIPSRPDFQQVRSARFRDQLKLVYGPPAVYDVSYALRLYGQPFGSVRIGVSPVFLKREINIKLMHALYFSVASIFFSLLFSAGISNLALGPLKAINRNLDSMAAGDTEELTGDESAHDEYGLVTLKIAHLGRQIRAR